ncbi:hypothetical protein K458DRAFT_418965 [Lentithecium fluviatile CBS 122367]|uniref:Uncharacterized protein n=1 Tax=Lentithecium fluviatile CBS 122367 TaxID=1168545 RepID=A0A6G1IZG8_9PLEO|nr:hypothetical protein K458DRAFT_418965 [Lentithecium fluviatile CBS 122367]
MRGTAAHGREALFLKESMNGGLVGRLDSVVVYRGMSFGPMTRGHLLGGTISNAVSTFFTTHTRLFVPPSSNLTDIIDFVHPEPSASFCIMSAKITPPACYTLPPRHLRNPIIICGIVMAISANRRIIAPGSLLHEQVLPRSPTTFKTLVWMQLIIFWFLYGVHTIETAIFATKLWKAGVSVLSLDWWKWMCECFVGGKFCFEHFEGVVKGKKV